MNLLIVNYYINNNYLKNKLKIIKINIFIIFILKQNIIKNLIS